MLIFLIHVIAWIISVSSSTAARVDFLLSSIFIACVGFQRDMGCFKGATSFALRNGIEATDTLTDDARRQFEEWRIRHKEEAELPGAQADREESHDTVGVICLDDKGNLCAGTQVRVTGLNKVNCTLLIELCAFRRAVCVRRAPLPVLLEFVRHSSTQRVETRFERITLMTPCPLFFAPQVHLRMEVQTPRTCGRCSRGG